MASKKRKKEPAKQAPQVYPARVKAAIGLVLVMAAVSAIALLREPLDAGQDIATASQERFAALRQALPAHGTVGYVSDRGGDNPGNSGAYYLTQYALAPLLVLPDSSQDLLVGNFGSPQKIQEILQKHNLSVVRDFQNGVLLLRKARP